MEDNKFQIEVLSRLSVLETLIKEQDYKGVKETSENAMNKALNNENRIKNLEDSQKWLLRLVIGAVIGGILAFVFKM